MLEIADLMPGARNCVNGYCAIQPDERVLLWLDGSDTVDPTVVNALVKAIDETGAPLSVLRTKAPIFRYGERLSPVEEGAISNANVLMHVFDLENAASVDNADIYRCMWEHELRVTSVIAMAGNLDNARQLPAPTGVAILHIMSERDQYNPYTASIAFDRAHLASPRALLTLRGAPHEPPYDEPADPHFAIVVRATVDFLDATVGHRFARLDADATAAGALAAFERS